MAPTGRNRASFSRRRSFPQINNPDQKVVLALRETNLKPTMLFQGNEMATNVSSAIKNPERQGPLHLFWRPRFSLWSRKILVKSTSLVRRYVGSPMAGMRGIHMQLSRVAVSRAANLARFYPISKKSAKRVPRSSDPVSTVWFIERRPF